MKLLATLCATAAIALTMSACHHIIADTHDADVKAINDTESQWNQDYAAKDLDKVVAHYADDAVLIVPGAPPATGKDTIRSEMKQMMNDPAMTLTFKASRVEVAKSGAMGYTEGSYKLTVTDPTTHKVINEHGSYATTYRQQADRTWKAVIDIVTSEVPPASSSH